MEESDNPNTNVFKIPIVLPEKPQLDIIETQCKSELISENKNASNKENSEQMEPKTESEDASKTPESSVAVSENTTEIVQPSKVKISTQPIPYNEPSWGGLPDAVYSLEEMKAGVSLRTIPLDQRSFFCFGRFDNCHIVMAHPTVSRYHAILQFRCTFSASDEKKGFYLFDLGSTHGTFLNKQRIQPRIYIKVQVGHIIKFGSSTRWFLLHGPEDDQEAESQFSYTQLCEMRKKELEKRQNDYMQDRAKLCGEIETEDNKEEPQGIDWGMGEDADEETDLTENPFAETLNEDLYIDDPKKTLRCWFEREGQDLEYKIEEKGFGQFRCTIELPIENAAGGFIVAEATISGKKKEAAHHCALEACRILDRAGLLKQSNQESRKRKLKNWEEDDYYDSDEDNFFDRTGELEAKRKQRMNQVKKKEPVTDTYETLVEKHKLILKEIEEMERKLNTMLVEAGSAGVEEENYDTFMSQKRSGQVLDKLELRKLKASLSNSKNNEEKLRKLIAFIKPFELPEIKVPLSMLPKESPKDTPPPMLIKEEPKDTVIVHNELASSKPKTHGDESKPGTDNGDTKKQYTVALDTQEKSKMGNEDVKKQYTVAVNTEENSKTGNVDVKKEYTVALDTQEKSKTESTFSSSDNFVPLRIKPKRLKPTKTEKINKSFNNQYDEDFNNIVWKPPTGQTGDGRISLNDKLGY